MPTVEQICPDGRNGDSGYVAKESESAKLEAVSVFVAHGIGGIDAASEEDDPEGRGVSADGQAQDERPAVCGEDVRREDGALAFVCSGEGAKVVGEASEGTKE